MIAYIALVLSIINSILWVVFAVGIRKMFKMLYPMFKSFGIIQSENLTPPAIYDKIEGPDLITNPNKPK